VQLLSADELAAALKDVGGFVSQLRGRDRTALAAIEHFFARVRQNFPALLGPLGEKLPRFPTALWRIKQRDGGADSRAYQKPRNADSTIFTAILFLPKEVHFNCIAIS